MAPGLTVSIRPSQSNTIRTPANQVVEDGLQVGAAAPSAYCRCAFAPARAHTQAYSVVSAEGARQAASSRRQEPNAANAGRRAPPDPTPSANPAAAAGGPAGCQQRSQQPARRTPASTSARRRRADVYIDRTSRGRLHVELQHPGVRVAQAIRTASQAARGIQCCSVTLRTSREQERHRPDAGTRARRSSRRSSSECDRFSAGRGSLTPTQQGWRPGQCGRRPAVLLQPTASGRCCRAARHLLRRRHVAPSPTSRRPMRGGATRSGTFAQSAAYRCCGSATEKPASGTARGGEPRPADHG